MGKKKREPVDAATIDKAIVRIMRGHAVIPITNSDLVLALLHKLRVVCTPNQFQASLKRLRAQGLLKRSPTTPTTWLFIVPIGLKKRHTEPLVKS